AAVGLHTGFQDSTPMILFIGQVARDMMEREAFQEVDYRRMFGQMAKWVAQIDDARRIPEFVSHAFHLATSGRPGPVVLALPEDMLTDEVSVADAGPYRRVQAHPGPGQMAELRNMLQGARHPIAILGGGTWTAEGAADMRAFAEANCLPVACSFRCQDYFDNDHPNYVGDVGIGINPKLAARIARSDLVLAIGPRLGEMTTGGYAMFDIPVPRQPLVHVHPGAEELGRVYQAKLMINSGMAEFAAAARAMAPIEKPAWAGETVAMRAEYEAHQVAKPQPGPLDMAQVVAHLTASLPRDAIVTNGAGNYATWIHRFHRYRTFRSQLAPTSGAMGYGVPAAIAAKLRHPDRVVVSLNGDGCFLMCGQELATAVQYGVNVIFLVVNNGMYGTIRMHQEREYPARISGTELVNPDFAAFARSFGAQGELVERTADFAPAFERALHAAKPALIELRIDPEQISPRTTLSEIRAASLAKRS
ncbi:MAG: thiamine pyrophosphate-binding protein, partial [Alphaproteobacteria bacterium]|nr:thiamine pyrophosphate-binding protein [Alphaproteobacteria bacterium]